MRNLTMNSLLIAAPLFMVLMVPGAARAGTGPVVKDCPVEPAQGVAITSGETYYGTNCSLSTTGDADTFTFNAAAGDVWEMVAGLGPSPTTQVCLTLYSPGVPANQIFNACTCNGCFGGSASVSTNQTLTTAGLYTIKISETNDGVQAYGLSLERLSPTPPDAVALTLAKNVTGDVSAPTSQNTFTFNGGTTGTYEIAVSLAPNPTSQVCMNAYQPNGTSALSGGTPLCTCNGCFGGSSSFQADLTPSLAGTYVVNIYAGGNDTTVDYNLEVSCLLGNCPPAKPSCLLTDSPSYDASTGILTMDFSVGTPVAATWNGFLEIKNKIESVFSQSLPVTEPATKVTQTKSGVGVTGDVGILSTITTPGGGITCSSFVTVNTGTP